MSAETEPVTLRSATPADLEQIMAIETAVFMTDAWSPAMMRDELAAPHSHYLVAERGSGRPGEEIVAYAGLRAIAGSADADIQTIAVTEEARGRGLGRALMVALLREASRRGAREVFLEVRADNPNAQRLYLSLGFERLGVRPRYYQPDDVDALVMRLTLGDDIPKDATS